MSALNLFGMINNMSRVLGELERLGLRVEVGDDFVAYRNYRNQCQGRAKLSPVFDVSCSFIDETNGFWVCAFDDDNCVVHTQAVRLLSLIHI